MAKMMFRGRRIENERESERRSRERWWLSERWQLSATSQLFGLNIQIGLDYIMLPVTCIHLPIYCTISINLPIGVTRDTLAEILVSARGENRRDKPPKYRIFVRFWSIREMDSPISHHDV